MTADRIAYQQLGQLTAGREDRTARAISNAVHGINDAEAAIRRNAAFITSKVTETISRLDHGLGLNDLGELQHAPADFDRAVVARQHHWKVLGALLTDAEIAALQPPRRPPPDRLPATARSRDLPAARGDKETS